MQYRWKIAHQLIVSIHMVNPTFIHFNHRIPLLSKSHKTRVCIFNCICICTYIYIYIQLSFYNKYILSYTGYTYNLPGFFSYPQTSIRIQAQLRGICVISTGAYGLKEANFLEATGFKWWPRVTKLPVDDKNPVNNGTFTISIGAGFFPSTVFFGDQIMRMYDGFEGFPL